MCVFLCTLRSLFTGVNRRSMLISTLRPKVTRPFPSFCPGSHLSPDIGGRARDGGNRARGPWGPGGRGAPRPLDEVAPLLGYVRNPADRTRWRQDGSVLSVTGVRYFDHLQGRGGGAGTRVALKIPPMATAVKARRSTQYAGRTKVQYLRSRWSVMYVIPGKFHENVLNFTHAHPAPPKFNVPEAKTPESSSPP